MKSFREYLAESAHALDNPVVGDDFAIIIREECLIESYVVDTDDQGGIFLYADDAMMKLLESYGFLSTQLDEGMTKQAMHDDAERMSLEDFCDKYGDEDWVKEFWHNINDDISEAEYHGRNVPLGKPMQGDVKKSKVYVKGPKGNVVKVNFGDPDMKIKKSNPKRRKSFRARHNCENPGPRWKARYWSCRAW